MNVPFPCLGLAVADDPCDVILTYVAGQQYKAFVNPFTFLQLQPLGTIKPIISISTKPARIRLHTMSSNSYSTFQSSSYSSYSDSSGNKYEESTSSNPSGTTTHRSTQEAGKPAIQETTRVPAGGRVEGLSNEQHRIEDVSDKEDQAAKEYEERMEDEYAKREGGA